MMVDFHILVLLGINFAVLVILFVMLRKERPETSASDKVATEPGFQSEPPGTGPPGHPLHMPPPADHLPSINYTVYGGNRTPRSPEDVDQPLINAIEEMLAGQPPLPSATFRINNLLRTPGVTAKEIAGLVATNPILSSRLLRTVNSTYFGLTAQVTSIGRAVTLLGFNTVRSLVIREALQKALPGLAQQSNEQDHALWLHSTAVSACAFHLSRNVFRLPDSDLGTMGLFHDIGKYFFPLLPGHGPAEAAQPPLLTEDQHYGINHSRLGRLVADHWEMPEEIAACILYHHHPLFFDPGVIPEQHRTPAFIVCLADLICRVLEGGEPKQVLYIPRPAYFEMHNLQPDPTAFISRSLIQEIDKTRQTVEGLLVFEIKER